MISVIILTKNILIEKELQAKLQRLNYEVFCCSNLFYLTKLQEKIFSIINYFDIVIFNETITENEMQQILAYLPESKVILRKLEKESEIQLEGVDGWISEQLTIEELRENLSQWGKSPISQYEENKQMDKLLFLSSLERRTLEYLYQANGQIISREDLCAYLWKDGATKSRLAQLSLLIKKLRIAFKKSGVTGETIETSWGEGYQLTVIALNYYESCATSA
ncbi:hypothetical protein IGI39_004798 [Enterococcus sp. AZ135]|uniref:winged helix-turn-helix domain-containing protein n=1 Tax=unclassified Enterococcus TaxID=2608891 RepID=UPI003F1E5B85